MVISSLLTASFAATAEQSVVTIGFQKASLFTIIKSRQSLEKQFSPQGVTVRWVEFPAGPQMLEGLNIGAIDLAATGDAPPIFAQAAQADLIYLAHSVPNPNSEAIVVPENSSIHTIADLKGKRVALNKGSDVNYLLVAALQKAGLSYKDIQPVYLPPADARAAFQKGAVDAWAIWDPYLAEVSATTHARTITTAEGLVPHYSFYLASRKFAEGSPKLALQVEKALEENGQWANNHKQETAQLLSAATGLGINYWHTTLARIDYTTQRMTPDVFKQQQNLADTFSQIHLIPKQVDVSNATWSLDKKN
nr:sulfonate ABC transporter substrate-binding protein [Rosenbergiella australiborealis]